MTRPKAVIQVLAPTELLGGRAGTLRGNKQVLDGFQTEVNASEKAQGGDGTSSEASNNR